MTSHPGSTASHNGCFVFLLLDYPKGMRKNTLNVLLIESRPRWYLESETYRSWGLGGACFSLARFA